MSHLPQNSALYAPHIYAPSIQSNQTHGYLKAIHLPREVYSEHHLQIPHEIYPDEIVRTHSCPSVQVVEDSKNENKVVAEKRKKNREAAAACRQRRMDLIGKLEENVGHLENEIKDLRRVMDLLTQKNESLAELLETHNIKTPKTLLAKFDKKIAELTKNSVLKSLPKVVNQPLKRGRKRKVDIRNEEVKVEPITPKLFATENSTRKEETQQETHNTSQANEFLSPNISVSQNHAVSTIPHVTLMTQEEITERPRNLLINNDAPGCTLALFSFNTPTVHQLNLLCQQTGITPIAALPKIVVPTSDRDHPSKDNELHPL
uniref:BZIP domain-containing protein n=1 Tax=Acrobeloides nanus TaxID=290746 RepID=A0A914C5Q9_9BILA